MLILKVLTVCALVASCYCADNELVVEETRAKKKKNTARLWAMVLLFILSKVAVFKVASVVILMTVFQKLASLGGLLLSYYMRSPPAPPAPQYGPPSPTPADYQTLGYSYGPPSASPSPQAEIFAGQEYGLPASDGPFNNWLFNKS